ncbi:MAG: histidine kinase [Flavobacteriaceae bacterium]|nr:histidine kinase [Flavobacteriaceae bacterium]
MLKKTLYIVLLSVIVCINTKYVFAQLPEYPIRLYTKEVGLSYNFETILQDTSNFIWVMYRYEVQRFDGSNMDSFFKGQLCYSLIKDLHGQVWVSTESGIYKFNNERSEFAKVSSDPAVEGSKLLLRPYDHQVQFISRSGIYYYEDKSNSFIRNREYPKALFSNMGVRHEHASNYEHVAYYYFAGDSICQYNLKTREKEFISFPQIRNVIALSATEFIVSNWESKAWYYSVSNKKRQRIVLDEKDPSMIIFDAISADNGHFYLATSKGLLSYEPASQLLKKVELSLDGLSFPSQRFNVLYKADNNTIWASTENSLLFFNDDERNIHFIKGDQRDPSQKFTSDVRNFTTDETGNLWLATRNGLTYWNIQEQRFSTIFAKEKATNKINHPSIRGLAFDGDNLIIGQTNKGIWLYNTKSKTFKRPYFETTQEGNELKAKLERDFVHQIKTLKNGNHVVTARDGVYILDGKTYRIRDVDFPGKEFNVKFSYEDEKGDIFFGTYNGLYCLDNNLNYKYHIREELESVLTFTLLEHSDGYFLGTQEGIYFFTEQNNEVTVEKVIPELGQEWIMTIFKDNNNFIWFVATDKLHRYNPETESIHTFGFTENIHGDFFHPNSFFRNEQGLVFIGGTNGINYFYPEKIELVQEDLHPYIRTVNIPKFDSLLPYASTPTLNYNNKNVRLELSTPYFGNHNDLYYRYQMFEDGAWYELGTVKGTNLLGLTPGNYQLKIASSLDKVAWYESPRTFDFTIRPPFWKRLWFISTMTLLTAFIMLKLYTSFQRKLRTEQLLNSFIASIYEQNTVDDILWGTAQYCTQKLNFVDTFIYLVDSRRKRLIQHVAVGTKNLNEGKLSDKLELPISKGILGSVAQKGTAERISNTDKDDRYTIGFKKALSKITVPIPVDGKVYAIIDSEHPKRNFFKKYHLKVLEKMAVICSERLTKYLSEENIRSEIARDLHDEMGSTLSSIHIISKMAEKDTEDMEHVQKQFSQINKHTSGMMDKMSDMIWVVNPANDSLDKLIYKIKEYAVEILEPTGIDLSFEHLSDASNFKINAAQRKNIYLIAKEAINNIVKHSNATQAKVIFKYEDNFLITCIDDNGIGFDTSNNYKGHGIKNLQSRAEEINAHLVIESKLKNGVSLCLRINKENLQYHSIL